MRRPLLQPNEVAALTAILADAEVLKVARDLSTLALPAAIAQTGWKTSRMTIADWRSASAVRRSAQTPPARWKPTFLTTLHSNRGCH